PEDVPALSAPEAVVEAGRGLDGEGAGFLGMEGAQADEPVVPGLLQLEVLGDELNDVGSLANRRDVLLPDATCHPSLPSAVLATATSPGEGTVARTFEARTGPSCRRCSRPRAWGDRRGSSGIRPEPLPGDQGSTRRGT